MGKFYWGNDQFNGDSEQQEYDEQTIFSEQQQKLLRESRRIEELENAFYKLKTWARRQDEPGFLQHWDSMNMFLQMYVQIEYFDQSNVMEELKADLRRETQTPLYKMAQELS